MFAPIERNKLASFLESRSVTIFITTLILINAVTLGIETDRETASKYSSVLDWMDLTILMIFSAEIVLKLYVYRLRFFH